MLRSPFQQDTDASQLIHNMTVEIDPLQRSDDIDNQLVQENELLNPRAGNDKGKDYKIIKMNKNGTENANEVLVTLKHEIKRTEKNLVPPDGGWGLLVLFGGFSTLILVTLLPVGYGILFEPLWKYFRASSTTIAWIYNAQVCILNITHMLVGSLCEEFGYRKIAFTSGILNGFAFILSGFAPSPLFLFFSFSTLGGIGGSFGISASIFIVSKYFLKKRGLAIGVVTLGVCCGAFIGPLLSNFLVVKYGFRGACLIFGGVLLNQCVAAALYEPVEKHLVCDSKEVYRREDDLCEVLDVDNDETEAIKFHSKIIENNIFRRYSQVSDYSFGLSELFAFPANEQSKNGIQKMLTAISSLTAFETLTRISKSPLKSLGSLRSLKVRFIAVSAGLVMMGYMNFQMWIPFVVRDAGHSLELSAWCLSSAAISNTIARIFISAVADTKRFSVRGAYVTGMLLVAVSIAAFPLRAEFLYLVFWAVIWGIGIGISMSLYFTTMLNAVGDELFPSVFGVSSLFIALFFIVIGPILGIIQDKTSNYQAILWIISGCTFLAVPLWLLMPVAAKYDKKRAKRKINILG